MMKRIDAYFESAIEGTDEAQDFDSADMKAFALKHIVIIGGATATLAVMVGGFA